MRAEVIIIVVGTIAITFIARALELLLKKKALLKQAPRENVLFRRIENFSFKSDSTESNHFKEPCLYKTKLNYAYIVLFIAFIFFGFFFIYYNRNEKEIFDRYFSLFFTVYGIIMLIKYLTTKYIVNKKALDIYTGLKKHSITYSNILEIQRRDINLAFKHGIKGRIRAETSSKTLFITFIDDANDERVIMISPKLQERFIEHLLCKIREA